MPVKYYAATVAMKSTLSTQLKHQRHANPAQYLRSEARILWACNLMKRARLTASGTLNSAHKIEDVMAAERER
jgi:hypothetical protein